MKPNKNNTFILGLCNMIFLGQSGLFRPCELSYRKYSNILKRNQLIFHPNIDNPTDIFINLYNSKTNKIGKLERISVSCCCNRKLANEWNPCTVHSLKRYVLKRDKQFSEI